MKGQEILVALKLTGSNALNDSSKPMKVDDPVVVADKFAIVF